MKILYLSFDPGISFGGTKGASIHIREFTKALRSNGHEVEIAVAKLGATEATHDGVWELPAPESDFFQMKLGHADTKLVSEAKTFARNFAASALAGKHFDLVYERYSLFGIAGLTLARQRGVPYVLEVNSPLVEEERCYRSLILEPLAKAVESFLFSQADCIIAVSEGVKSYISTIADNDNVIVLPNGVDAGPFVNAKFSPDLRQTLGGSKFLIGFVGSLKPWHGVDVLLEAVHSLAEEEEVGVVFVGDGPMLEPLRETCGTPALAGKAVFTGAIEHEQIPEVMKAVDVLVAPYPDMQDMYFSPMKVFEYMASGRPVVASRIGQLNDILEDERNALLVPPGNAEALADALLRLKSDAGLRERLARAAQEDVQSQHTWNMRVRTVEPIFESLRRRTDPYRIELART